MGVTKHKITSDTREPRGQHFPSSDHKAARNGDGGMAKTNAKNKYDSQKKYRLGTISKKILKGLNQLTRLSKRLQCFKRHKVLTTTYEESLTISFTVGAAYLI